jgi:hypothetical protein
MESGLRPATAQLENRQRRFGLRLPSLPDGDQARELVGAASGIGKRLKNALAHRGRTETTYSRSQRHWTPKRPRRTRRRPRLKRNAYGQGSPCSRTDHDSTAEQLGTQSYGRTDNPGWESKTTWDTTKKPTTQNTRHWQEPLRRRQNARRCRNGSPFLPTPKPPLGEWYRRPRPQVRNPGKPAHLNAT